MVSGSVHLLIAQAVASVVGGLSQGLVADELARRPLRLESVSLPWRLWALLPGWSQAHPLISVSPSGKMGEQQHVTS